MGSCAKALIALEERGKWEDERAVAVMEAYVKSAPHQDILLTQDRLLNHTHPLRDHKSANERYSVLRLIDTVMAKYREALRKQHEETQGFLSRFISYFDGEKDPRNLMVVFSILRVPMTEWNIGADAQVIISSCYGPWRLTALGSV